MNKQNKILLIKISFIAGAIIDALAAAQMLIPNLWASYYGLTNYNPSPQLTFALTMASALMWGWTGLLLWGFRKPLERKGILLLTVFPVVFGLAANNVYAFASDFTVLQSVLPTLMMQCIMSALFVFSYFTARKETV